MEQANEVFRDLAPRLRKHPPRHREDEWQSPAGVGGFVRERRVGRNRARTGNLEDQGDCLTSSVSSLEDNGIKSGAVQGA